MRFLVFATYGDNVGFFVGATHDRRDGLTLAQARRDEGLSVAVRSLETLPLAVQRETMASAAWGFFTSMDELPGEEVQL